MIDIEQHIKDLSVYIDQLAKTQLNDKQNEMVHKTQHNIRYFTMRWASLNGALDPANIAHTLHALGNALTPIVGYVQVLAKGLVGPLDDDQHQLLSVINNMVERLRRDLTHLKNAAT